MKTLSDTADLLATLAYNTQRRIYENEDNPEYDATTAKENFEMLNLAFRVVMDRIEEDKENKGDRLDRLLDELEKNSSRTMHSISCVCVTLGAMEDHLYHIGEYDAAGRCNKIQHKYLDKEE